MKIRIKFTKTGTMRFIGHLDLMRYFQKLMRRAKVDIRYSEGFSPHQIMSFATAMGLGMTSEGEYVDIDVLSTESSEEMIRRINAASNEEIQVLKYCRIPDETKSAMSQIAAADYVVSFPLTGGLTADFLHGKVEEFCSESSIVLLKKTKKSEQEVDIRPMIFSFSGIAEDEAPKIVEDESPEIAEDGGSKIAEDKGSKIVEADGSEIAENEGSKSAEDEGPEITEDEDSEIMENERRKNSGSLSQITLKDVSICPEYITEIAPAPGYARFFLRLSTGSEQNLKPELVMEAFSRFLGLEMPEEETLKIHRTEIYGRREGALVPLSSYGWDINRI